jgi:HlyD family secretion protein
MRTKQRLAGLLILVAVILISGCGKTPAAQTPEGEVPVVARAAGTVVAEAVIEPARWSNLSFEIAGQVAEVRVHSGDQIQEGALLLRLDTRELELSLQNARQEVLAQQAALDQLLRGTRQEVIARADKDNADQIAQAEIALRARQLQLDKARLEDPAADVAAAQARVEQLRLQLAQTRTRDPAPDITSAQVGLERAQIALDDTQDEYNQALDRPWEDQAIRDRWADQLEQVQLDYRLAQAQLEGAQKAQRAHAINLKALEAQVEEAEAQLARARVAQETYPVSLEVLAVDIDAAQADVEALRTWENPHRDEPLEEEVAQAQVRVRKAEIAAAQLELQLEDAELRAPFGGTVVEVEVEVGDQVSPGQVVLVLATLEELEVHTTDLTELDVGRIAVGQPAEVSVDALPDERFAGVVSEIALQGEDYRGDVVYEVTVELTEAELPEALRWGMTTMVEIETE